MNQAGPEIGAQEQRGLFEGGFSSCRNSSVVVDEHQQEEHPQEH